MMTNLRTPLLSILFALLVTCGAAAQLQPGSYVITDDTGASPSSTHEVGVDIVDNGDGTFTGKVWMRDPNQTPRPLKSYLANEFIKYEPKDDGPGYKWKNTGRPNGGTGCMIPMPFFPCVWISVVETGTFKGEIRILWPEAC